MMYNTLGFVVYIRNIVSFDFFNFNKEIRNIYKPYGERLIDYFPIVFCDKY